MKRLVMTLLVLASTGLGACTAVKQQAATTEASTEWRLKSLEESFLNFRETQRQMKDEDRERNEALESRLRMLEERLDAMTVRPESQDSAASAGDQGWVTDLSPEQGGWIEGQAKETRPGVVESGEEKPWAEVPGGTPAAKAVPVPEVKPANIPEPKVMSRPKPVAKPAAVTSSQSMYDKALGLYRADDFEGARGAFDEFLARFPKDSLIPNALYWKGETYYSQKDYAQAILAFKDVTARFPKHHKAASALLKIGMAYELSGDKDNARFYLRALVEDFPKSEPARMGRKRLAALGG